MKSAWPTSEEVLAILGTTGLNFQALTPALVDNAVAAAVTHLESKSGYRPFLSDGLQTTRDFILTDNILTLDGGLLEPTSLIVGTIEYSMVNDLGLYFHLRPDNAPARNLPFTYIVFVGYWFTAGLYGPMDVQVTGAWGFGKTIPDEVWNAVLMSAAARLLSLLAVRQLATMAGGGMIRRKQDDDVMVEYHAPNVAPMFSGLIEAWNAPLETILKDSTYLLRGGVR